MEDQSPVRRRLLRLAALGASILLNPASARNDLAASAQLRLGVTPQAGDVIFRRGVGTISQVVLGMDAAGVFSHAGMISLDSGAPRVIHAVPAEAEDEADRTKSEPLAVFLDPTRASRLALYRLDPRHVPDAERRAQQASEAAEDMARRAVPFDREFDLASGDAVYCTELVWRAFLTAGVDLEVHPTQLHLPFLRQPVLLPSDLQSSPKLRRVG